MKWFLAAAIAFSFFSPVTQAQSIGNGKPIRIIVDETNPLHLTDTKWLSKNGHYGPSGTFNGFGPKEKDEAPIDYIFVKGPWRVLQHATIAQTWGGRFASDHFAVMAVVQLGK